MNNGRLVSAVLAVRNSFPALLLMHNFNLETWLGVLRYEKKKLFILLGLAIFIALLKCSIIEGIEANNCFAILVFATVLWASEVRVVYILHT